PRSVADDTTADRDDGVAPQESPAGETPAQVVDRRERLAVLAVTHEERLVSDAGALERVAHAGHERVGDGGLGHDCRAPASGEHGGELGDRAGADDDVVAAFAQTDVRPVEVRGHTVSPANASSTAPATAWMSMPSVSTLTCAAASYAGSRSRSSRASAPT